MFEALSNDEAWRYCRWIFVLLVPAVVWLVFRSIDKEARLRQLEGRYRASLRTVADLVTRDGNGSGSGDGGKASNAENGL